MREVSLCALGADWQTTARLFSQPAAGQKAAADTDPPKDSTMPTIEELQAQLATANADKAALLADKTAAEAAAKAAAAAQRDSEISTLFRECGTPGTEGERKALASLEPALFAEMATAKRATAAKLRQLDPKLFADQATNDTAGAEQGKAKTDADKEAAAGAFLSDANFYGRRDAERRKALAAGAHFAG